MSICGTNAGYQKHCVDKTEKCQPCKEAHSEYITKYYLKNSENIKQKRKDNYIKNREKEKESVRIWRINNLEYNREYQRKHKKLNPHIKRESERRRRTLKKNGNVQKYKESEVLDLYGWVCHICNGSINPAASRSAGIGDWELGLHIDHLIPISKGGEDSLSNVRPSHAVCNLKKHAKPLSK